MINGWRRRYIPMNFGATHQDDKLYTLRELLEPYNGFFKFPQGRVLVMQPEHVVAVVDGVIHDTFDSSDLTVEDIWIHEQKYADLWVLPRRAHGCGRRRSGV